MVTGRIFKSKTYQSMSILEHIKVYYTLRWELAKYDCIFFILMVFLILFVMMSLFIAIEVRKKLRK